MLPQAGSDRRKGVELRSVSSGETMFRQGEPSSGMWVVRSGQVRLMRRTGDGDRVIAILGKGDFFGEIGMLLGVPRASTAQVLKDSELIELEADAFNRLVRENSLIALQFIRIMALRVERLENEIAG